MGNIWRSNIDWWGREVEDIRVDGVNEDWGWVEINRRRKEKNIGRVRGSKEKEKRT